MCLLVLPLTGCTRGGLSGLAPAAGIVTLNGASVEGATIGFVPAAASPDNRAAAATTDKDGKFVVTTFDYGDGIYPGEYQVFVTKTTVTGGYGLPGADGKPRHTDDSQIVNHLPVKYGDKNTSGLTVSISSQGNKNIELKLEGEVDLTPRKPVDVKK